MFPRTWARPPLAATLRGLARTRALRHLATPTGPGTQDAAGASYSLVDADEGNTIKVKVSFADDAGQRGIPDQRSHGLDRSPSQLTRRMSADH